MIDYEPLTVQMTN